MSITILMVNSGTSLFPNATSKEWKGVGGEGVSVACNWQAMLTSHGCPSLYSYAPEVKDTQGWSTLVSCHAHLVAEAFKALALAETILLRKR